MNATPAANPWRWWVCALLLAATTLNYMDRVALNQTANDLIAAWQLSNLDYARLESGFQVAFAVGAILAGVLVDRFGVRLIYPLAVLGWSACGFLTGFAPNYLVLFACRFGLGVFEAGNWPCGVRTVRQIMPPVERSLGNAIFHSGTGLGAMITPLIVVACYSLAEPGPLAWQVPFRVIGAIGLVWVALWWCTVPPRVLDAPPTPAADATPADESFWDVFADRRFWLLILVVIGVNTTWHTFRVWLPLFLKAELSYDAAALAKFTFAYYAVADVGSWLVGFAVLGLSKLGFGVHRSRMIAFAAGVGLVLTATALPFVRGQGEAVLLTVILTTGFGALGLFAAYFALSQEISGRHQGKITGVLGAINSAWLAGLYVGQGQVLDAKVGYDLVLAVAGVPALVALLSVALLWPPKIVPLTDRSETP